MASLEGNELYKYAYRVEVFVKKLEEKSKFKIVNKGEVELVPQKSIIKHIKEGKPTRNLILIDTDGNEYKFNQIEKTKEFGGKGAGASTAKEDAELTSLKEQLEEAKKTGFTKHQIAGLISSLDEKGVLYIEYRHPDGTEGPDLYYLSENFINFIARANIANGTGRYVFARQEAN